MGNNFNVFYLYQSWQSNLGERTEVVSGTRATEGASQLRRQDEAMRPEQKLM